MGAVSPPVSNRPFETDLFSDLRYISVVLLNTSHTADAMQQELARIASSSARNTARLCVSRLNTLARSRCTGLSSLARLTGHPPLTNGVPR
jgi:hypothetical protein